MKLDKISKLKAQVERMENTPKNLSEAISALCSIVEKLIISLEEKMHPNAYGLTRKERERLVQMAKSNLYYERYLSNRFRITDEAVRDICARMGNYRCRWIDDQGKHHDGYEITNHSSGSEKEHSA